MFLRPSEGETKRRLLFFFSFVFYLRPKEDHLKMGKLFKCFDAGLNSTFAVSIKFSVKSLKTVRKL